MSNESRKREKEGRKTVKELTKVVNQIPNLKKATNTIKTIPQNNEFKLALLNNGITEKFVADRLREAMEATTTKVDDKQGKVYVNADNNTRLKAIEMWINVFGYKEINKTIPKEGSKHVHLHGLTKEELDNALRAASIGEDKKKRS